MESRSNNVPNILLVEDDPNLGFVIKDNLEGAGYAVDWCKDGEMAIGRFKIKKFNLCIVDVMLPIIDGFTVVHNIREKNEQVPVLFLTAKSMEEDRIKGFEIGADDYIAKPFNMEELLLRIRVFLKRSQASFEFPDASRAINIGKFLFRHNQLMLENPDKNKIENLTQKEADLLRLFARNIDIVLKREHILKSVWGESDYFLGRSLDVFISRLRKYLLDDPSIKIVNYHKVGFMLTTRVD
jgi:DNA-binding response OmpR family regulator